MMRAPRSAPKTSWPGKLAMPSTKPLLSLSSAVVASCSIAMMIIPLYLSACPRKWINSPCGESIFSLTFVLLDSGVNPIRELVAKQNLYRRALIDVTAKASPIVALFVRDELQHVLLCFLRLGNRSGSVGIEWLRWWLGGKRGRCR